MRLLLDENLPKKLKLDFPEFDLYTVREMGWQGRKNGELLQLMLDNDFTVLMTFDKNLRHQQNFGRYPVMVLVLNAPENPYPVLQPLVAKIKEALNLPWSAGPVIIQ